MSIWNRLFGTKAEPAKPQPSIKFGRYTDSYKQKLQYEAWEVALDKFEAQDYLNSYQAFFRYLRDDNEDNVRWVEENGNIKFEILQGSKRVSGIANAQKFVAEARIVHADNLSVAVMRRLVEFNYVLEYSRYGLDDDNNLVIKFDTSALDGSPYKLYYALKEVAANADKQDDLLLDEFGMQLKPIDMGSKADIPNQEKEIKYKFLTQKIQFVISEIDSKKLDGDKYPGGISYLLLDAAYRIDFLTSPEGFLMETIERMHRSYFSTEEKSMIMKNIGLRKYFEKVMTRSKELVMDELYATTSTFGILVPKQHDALVSLIDGELQNMDWYETNKHDSIAIAIPGYIVGFALFSYALPKPERALLAFYYKIFESQFFKDLGYTPQYYHPESGVFDQKAIKSSIRDIVEKYINEYPKLIPDYAILDYKTPLKLARTYLMMLKNMDFQKKENA
ncbi:MAG: hypothetical protein JNL70_08140 [Saprospiraceae bacterium]|nr:hypothetical protein [Saprospiraceae bacterium]